MKLKDALEMAVQANLCTIDKNMWAISEVGDGQYICAQLLHFAELVEQATLERAAKVCKDKAEMMEREAMQEGCDDEDRTSLRSGAWLFSVCGNEIRALKTQGE